MSSTVAPCPVTAVYSLLREPSLALLWTHGYTLHVRSPSHAGILPLDRGSAHGRRAKTSRVSRRSIRNRSIGIEYLYGRRALFPSPRSRFSRRPSWGILVALRRERGRYPYMGPWAHRPNWSVRTVALTRKINSAGKMKRWERALSANQG
jgi:hypothetical protein